MKMMAKISVWFMAGGISKGSGELTVNQIKEVFVLNIPFAKLGIIITLSMKFLDTTKKNQHE